MRGKRWCREGRWSIRREGEPAHYRLPEDTPKGMDTGGNPMSIAIMTQVWQRSQHKGSELLLLLAIADNANDQGVAYPSVRTLAKKTRLSARQVKRLIKVVELSGELRVSYETGPRGCNEYSILLGGDKMSPDEINRCHPGSKGGDIAVSPKPETKPKREEKTFSLSTENDPTGPEEVTLTPVDLKRLGLTPGSVVWRALLRDHGE
jgi:Helix-turn-helix domain